MRRQLVAQAAERRRALGRLLAQVGHVALQAVDLLLLAHNDLVQLFQQVVGETGLDLQVEQPAFDVLRIFHAGIRTHSLNARIARATRTTPATAASLACRARCDGDETNAVYNADPYLRASWRAAPRWTQDAGLRYSTAAFRSRDHCASTNSVIVNESNGRYYEPTPGRTVGLGAKSRF